jgi:hypothetical protein
LLKANPEIALAFAGVRHRARLSCPQQLERLAAVHPRREVFSPTVYALGDGVRRQIDKPMPAAGVVSRSDGPMSSASRRSVNGHRFIDHGRHDRKSAGESIFSLA